MAHGQHRAASGGQPPQRQPYMEPWPPAPNPGAQPEPQPQGPVKRKLKKHRIIFLVTILAFILQWPLCIAGSETGGPAGTILMGAGVCAIIVVAAGIIFTACYGLYRIVRWGLN